MFQTYIIDNRRPHAQSLPVAPLPGDPGVTFVPTHAYALAGFTSYDPVLKLRLATPYTTQPGPTDLAIIYGEDYRSYTLHDNFGETCARVHVLVERQSSPGTLLWMSRQWNHRAVRVLGPQGCIFASAAYSFRAGTSV